ncbi:protein TAPT1 homolog isoform X2 [Elysia marginata]|uniref:Protein TAPT1 homolog isoform X2 n=1 Tax=Elysia marginata TaxID=1093978 RepID=A0AAV4H6Y1_9GAST|nr:protein TAPT1 homolog isoform X2 [Elysia marginata]
MHCPLCVKTDAYQDPVILKAHYRVKHVDKGIDFAGLKILRCVDQCDIVGIIKGEKRFKGAHWHCYRCRNGFNRRDEAIKHYKTHFRNPQTTFQIQITQDLNSPPEIRSHEDHHHGMQDNFGRVHNPMETIIRPAISQQAVQITEPNVLKTVANSIHHGKTLQKVKHEPLEKGDGSVGQGDEETIMIIQGTQLETALASHIIDSGDLGQLGKTAIDPNLSWEIRCRMEEEEKNMYKAKAEEYKIQVDLLKQQVTDLETQLAQQRQLCLHELLDVFASDDHAQKQAASEQVAKLLEHCQAFLPNTSLSVLRGNPGDSIHLQGQQQETGVHNLQQDDQASKGQSIPGLMHDFESSHDGCSEALVLSADEHAQKQHSTGGITDEYQVICTSAEGQVIMASTLDTGSATVRPEQDTDLDNPTTISIQPHSVDQPEQAAMFAEILGQSEQQRMEVQAVLPEMPPDPSDQTLDAGPALVPQGDGTGLMSTECLMEVVAANGLASLGQDMTAAVTNASGSDPHNQTQGTFMVTLDDGQGIIIQHSADASVHQEDSDGVNLQAKDGPNSKFFKA